MDAADIVDVVSDFVTLKRAGANYKGLCPFHDDRTPSFMVSPAKNYCKCFSCGKGGNPVGFIMEHEQLSYPEALRWLARKYGITIEERELTAEEKVNQSERESMFIVNEWANKWFQEQLTQTEDGRNIGLTYFRGRGFRDDIIQKFQLGFSPTTRDACTQAALKAGYKEQFLISTPDAEGIAHGVGISIKRDDGTLYDRFAGRVIFPIFTVSGKVVGFGGRVLDAATKGVSVKYQNSPESVIYHKKSELYGLFHAKLAISKYDCVYMVEGYTDVISMHQAGVENVVASSGTALTHDQIRLLRHFTNNVIVIYDGDAAGIKASQRGIDMFLREGMNVRLLLLPEGKDPDDFARAHTPEQLQAYMQEHQVDFIKFKSNLLLEEAQGDPIRLSNLVNNIVQSIAVIPDEIKRTLYIRETAQLMNLPEHLVTQSVDKQVKLNIEEWKKEREREQKRKNAGGRTATPSAQPSSPTPPLQAGDPTPPSPPQDDPRYEDIPIDFPPTEGDPYGPANEAQRTLPPTAQPLAAQAVHNARRPQGDPIEALLVQAIIRHGERIICNVEDEDGERPLTVIEFIYYSLEQDQLVLFNPVHQSILMQGLEHVHEPHFNAERFFLHHPNQEINLLAFDLSTDREELSAFHSKSGAALPQDTPNALMELVTHLLTDLKLNIVRQRKKDIMQKMADPSTLKDRERYRSLMESFKEIKELEANLAKACGDRVISK